MQTLLNFTSFSGAASKTLKKRFPPGDTSSILAMLPHLKLMSGNTDSRKCSPLYADQDSPVAVVGRTPYGAEKVTVKHRVAFHAQLMSPKDMVHAIQIEKLPHNG